MSIAVLVMYGCACTSNGLELGAPSNHGRAAISIEWQSIDAFAGTMTATAAHGRTYSGPYLQIAPDLGREQLAPLWEGWGASHGWRSWHPESGAEFFQAYDGMVLANLRADGGDRMRCSFLLDFPSLGMDGGGAGKCQVLGGETTEAVFSAGREQGP